MILLQLSAGQGPQECALAVAHALRTLLRSAMLMGVETTVLESEAGPRPGTWKSVAVSLEGPEEHVQAMAAQWTGTAQWICPSPYRPGAARKNWFIGIARFQADVSQPIEPSQILLEPLRSSGPGGQHVNKTESSIRATHVPTGVTVRVQTARSQHVNKRLALLLLMQKLASKADVERAERKAGRRAAHHALERGNPSQVFVGPSFQRHG